jgi:hypothetical protein
MATKTLAQLRERTRFLGTYENSSRFTDALVNAEINAALGELYETMADAWEGHFDTASTTPTVAAQEHVDLPATFWRLRGVDILISGRYRELKQIGFGERNSFQTTGRPQAYRVAAGGARGRLILYPTPNAIETVRINYVPTFTPFSADGDSFEFYTGFDDYIVTRALLSLDQREERPLAERQQELDRLRQRIVKAAGSRRAAEPELLINRTTCGWYDDWEGGS